MGLTYQNKMIREYELYKKLQAMKLSENSYQKEFYKHLTARAEAAYDATANSGSTEKLGALIDALDELMDELNAKKQKHTTELSKPHGDSDSIYTDEGSRFYKVACAKADEMMQETMFEKERLEKRAKKEGGGAASMPPTPQPETPGHPWAS